MKPGVLIVDDEPNVRAMLKMALEMEYETFLAENVESCLQIVRAKPICVCLLDLRIGKDDGMDALQKIRDIDSSIAVIMITAYGSIKSSVRAIKLGAFSYLAKPLDLDELYMAVSRALEYRQLQEQVAFLSGEQEKRTEFQNIIGESAEIRRLLDQIDRIKDSDVSVVIIGESGTGKELVARALHDTGHRKNNRFVAINCAAIPGDLLEEEMFGHKKGAFTGAIADTKGKFEFANGGSLFLDEIGDMPLSLQGKLLRVLETKEFFPIGSNEKRAADVRIIAATNKNLLQLVERGEFRQDLYFRLSVVTLNVPPLRKRKEDLPLLEQYFIAKYNLCHKKNITGFSEGAAAALQRYEYPGNVRELINIIEYGVIFSRGSIIHVCDLPGSIIALQDGSTETQNESAGATRTLAQVEKEAIVEALKRNQSHVGRTAAELGVSDKGLRNKIAAYGIDVAAMR